MIVNYLIFSFRATVRNLKIELSNAKQTCIVYKEKWIELQRQNDILALKLSRIVKDTWDNDGLPSK